VGLLILGGVALFAGALVPTFSWFSFFAFVTGIASVVVQILIPFVAASSPPEKRAQNLGVIVSAALIGILLSRTFSGLLGGLWGWKAVYFAGGMLALIFAGVLRWFLPSQKSTIRIEYPVLIHSLWLLFKKIPALRSISLVGAFMYGSMCAFWTSLAFFLQDQYGWGPAVAGAFGLLGAVGALSAQLAGRLAQRVGPRRVVRACIVLMILSFALMAVLGANIYFLVLAVLLLDLGAQAATVSNQSELYKLHPEAQTRLNTIYKMLYFLGGSAGSLTAAIAWHHEKWVGVCLVGIAFLVGAGLVEITLMHEASKGSDSSAVPLR